MRVLWTARRSNQSFLNEINSIFIGRTNAEAPILWLLDVKSHLIGKDPDARKERRQKKREAENEMIA